MSRKQRWAVALLTLCVLTGITALSRAEVKIVGVPTYQPYKKIMLKAVDVTSTKASFLWDVDGLDDDQMELQGDKLYVWAGPGTYTVRLTAVDFDAKKVERTKFVFKVEGAPVPPPDPDPKPDPKPGPVSKAWVVVIEETSDATADRGKWLGDKNLAGYVKTKGWKLRLADKDVKDPAGQTPADLAPYIKRAMEHTLPYCFVVDQAGKIRFEGSLPAKPEDFLKELQKIGG